MELDSIAGYFDDTKIDVLSSSGRWQVNQFKGQLKLADDFISIFNRPTRRRMLTMSPKSYKKLNGTVIRIPASGEVFFVGNPQQDLGGGGSYRVTCPLNKAQDQVEVYRKEVEGEGEDVGALVSKSVGTYYMDLELRTLTADSDSVDATISRFFFWFPSDSPLSRGDMFDYNDETFKILEVFNDTGFRGVRATTEEDSREQLVYRQLTGDPIYDNASGTYSNSYDDFIISAEVKEITENRELDGQLFEERIYTVIIEESNIGVTPSLKDSITIDDEDRKIEGLVRNRHARTWEVSCR